MNCSRLTHHEQLEFSSHSAEILTGEPITQESDPLDLDAFWAVRERKIWVVSISPDKDTQLRSTSYIIRSKSAEGAIKVGLEIFGKPGFGSARLAHPVLDLECSQS